MATVSPVIYDTLFTNMQEVFFVCEIVHDEAGLPWDFRYLDINPAGCARARRRREEMAGHTYREVFPSSPNISVWLAHFARVVESGEPERFELFVDAQGVYYEVSAFAAGAGQCGVLMQDITGRKQTEAKLRESEARHFALFSEMMNGSALHEIVCDADGRPVDYITLEVNKAFERLLDARREDVVGHRASEILPPPELEKWLRIFGPVALTGQSTHYTMYSPLNQKHFEGVAYCPGKGKFAVTFMDVTERVRSEEERRQAEEALRASEVKYRSLFDTSLDAILLTVPDGQVVAANGAACRMFGYSEEEFVELGRDAIADAQDPRLAPALEERARTGRFAGELILVRKGGARFPGEISSVVFKDGEGRLRSSMVIRDITERKQAEEALRASEARYRELADENARLLAQSQKDAETKTVLLHEVNHRVKNNLAAIIGLLQLERRHFSGDQQTPYRLLLDDLVGRIQSLALVHNMLSASQWAPVPLSRLAENLMQVAPALLGREQPVRMDIASTSAQLSPNQASAVGLILNELVTNSLRHASRPHKAIRLRLNFIQTGSEICLEYGDNGPGYPDEVLRGSRERMGLYLLESLAEHDLEGTITLSNDRGAVARLRFALDPGAQPGDPPRAADGG